MESEPLGINKSETLKELEARMTAIDFEIKKLGENVDLVPQLARMVLEKRELERKIAELEKANKII